MNLLQLRTKFREISGRFDLVSDTFADTGADFYIWEGQKYLDRLNETQKSWASCYRFIEIGGFSAQFPFCRAIKEVWISTTTERWQLEKMDLSKLIAEYLTEPVSEREVGTPLYFSPTITRYIPEDADVGDIESFLGWVDVSAGNAHEYNSIILDTPVSEKVSIEIKGLFYSIKLVEDTDKNYWSEVHPMDLIMAAMRALEIVNRNTQGANDWKAAIKENNDQIGMDLVEELIAEVDQMEG